MTPNHEALTKLPLTEQARVMGTNHGYSRRDGYTVHYADLHLAALLSNAATASEYLAVRTAYREAFALACPPSRYVETVDAVREVFATGRSMVI